MKKNESSSFYATNEEDFPPLITEQQSTISYTVLKESFVAQTTINASPISFCLPSSDCIVTNKFHFFSSHKTYKEDVIEKPHPQPVEEEVDTAQSSEETIKENLLHHPETTMEMSDVVDSLAIIKVEDDQNKEFVSPEGVVKDEQVKSGGRGKRRKVFPDWIAQNFLVEARPRINGKTVDKYYYHKVTNVKCRSVIEAKDYLLHGINPNDSKKKKRMESERAVAKFFRDSYENVLTWYQKKDDIKTVSEETKNEELNETERGEPSNPEDKGKGVLVEEQGEPEDPEEKGEGIVMNDNEVTLDDGEEEVPESGLPASALGDPEHEPVAMEVSPNGPLSSNDKDLVDVPISWYCSE